MHLTKKIIFSCTLILLGLAVIELFSFTVLKILDISPKSQNPYIYHPLRHHAYRPNFQLRDTHGNLYTDRNGFILNDVTLEKPSITILLTGASTLGTPFPFTGADKTIASLIQHMMSKKFGSGKVKIQSLSITSYPTFHEMMLLYEYLEDMKINADIVSSINGLFPIYNFIDNINQYKSKDKLYDLFDKRPTIRLRQYSDGIFHIIPRTVYKFLLSLNVNTIRLIQFVNDKVILEDKVPAPTEKDWLIYKEDEQTQKLFNRLLTREKLNYKMMAHIANAHDMEFISVLLPAAYLWKNWPVNKMDSENIVKAHYQKIFYKKLSERNTLYPVYDLSHAFNTLDMSKNPFHKNDTVHYNDIGTTLIANKIFQVLAPYAEHKLRKKGALQ